jgi:hypothetical protein
VAYPRLPYWHFALHAPPLPAAFFPHASYAAASFLGFAAVGALADSMQPAPPEVQLWIVSSVDWQSLSLPQAAACFAQVLSTHLPQSVLSNDGGGGVDAAVDSEVGAAGAGAGVSADAAGDAEADEPSPVSEDADSDPLLAEAVSLDGVSGGFEPPPHASHTAGTEVRRTIVVIGKRLARIMVAECVARCGVETKHEE